MKRESTPFAILTIETNDDRHIWAKFYWSKNAGMYGHQVITEYNDGAGFSTKRTNGCGYCKKSSAFEEFIMQVTGKYYGMGGDLDYWLNGTEFHVGGNEYRLPIDKIADLRILRRA